MKQIFRHLMSAALSGLLVMTQCQADESPAITRLRTHDTTPASAAVLTTNAALVHTAQLLPAEGAGHTLDAQVGSVLDQLESLLQAFGSQRSDVIKLNVYLSTTDRHDGFSQQLARWCAQGEFPAVTLVTTSLPGQHTAVALDAVFASNRSPEGDGPAHQHLDLIGGSVRLSHATVLPRGDVLYVSGQAEQGDLPTATRDTLAGLSRTLEHLGLTRDHIVSLKCFVQPMSEIDVVNEQIAEFFGEAMIPPVCHVEWISSKQQPIEIELVAWAPQTASDDSVTYSWLPWLSKSPVYCRATRIHGDRRLYLSGLYSDSPGDGEQQVRSIFSKMVEILNHAGSDLRHLAKATYYVSDDDPSSQLNELRPEYYDPLRPPAASKAMVVGVGRPERGIVIDMIAAPAE